MNLPLKYLLPTLLLITGLFLVSIQTFIQMNNEYKRMIKHATHQAKVTGNRLASRITYEVKTRGFSEQQMVSLTAPYMAETLDQVNLYDQQLRPVFSKFIPSYLHDEQSHFESSIAYKVVKDKFSDIAYSNEEKHIYGYFPIDLPVQKGHVLSRDTGVMFLVFDVTQEYIETREEIIITAVIDVAIIIITIMLFSLLMYFMVFKRLDTLHKASLTLAEGNFNVNVETKGSDELTQVIRTFNSMAVDINSYIHDMQDKVNKAFQEQHEQSKIMIQQSRLASMGEMIGNIAHQWRQPLNALGLILQKMELFSQRGKLTDQVLSDNVQKANAIIENMSTTIDDFRDFFKPNKQMENFELSDVVHDVIVLQEAGLNEADIRINVSIDQPKCEVYGFKNEFAQVLINLINNSKDAFIENQIENRQIDISGKQKKGQIIFKLHDNAGGIPENILDRIFEPYYTTKEEGKGTGIGLYMSKMIIEENMNGLMQVRNNEAGAEFSMIFKKHKGQL